MPFKAAYDFIDQVTVFDTPSVDVVVAVNNVLACLQNGKPGNGLNSLWKNITVTVYTTRCSSEREPYMISCHKTVDGKRVMGCFYLSK